MHKGKYDAKALANKAADALANHGHFKSHSRHIDNCMAKDLGLAVAPLEDDPLLHDLVLSVFHATTITFQQGPTKIIENNTGKTFIKQPLVPPFQAPPRDAGPS